MGHMKNTSITQFCAAACVARWKLEPMGPAHLEMIVLVCQPNKPVFQHGQYYGEETNTCLSNSYI
jgi:hypothetical protein